MKRVIAIAVGILAAACGIPQQSGGGTDAPGYYGPQPVPPQPTPKAAPAPARRVRFNDRAATAQDFQVLARIESALARKIPDGSYWYDRATGAAGVWVGMTIGFLPAGLALGPALPANASGGGDGQLSAVFINGRELHPDDVKALLGMLGQPIAPGRYVVDAAGNVSYEGGQPFVNLVAVARKRGVAGNASFPARSAFAGGGCITGSAKTSYAYYASGCPD